MPRRFCVNAKTNKFFVCIWPCSSSSINASTSLLTIVFLTFIRLSNTLKHLWAVKTLGRKWLGIKFPTPPPRRKCQCPTFLPRAGSFCLVLALLGLLRFRPENSCTTPHMWGLRAENPAWETKRYLFGSCHFHPRLGARRQFRESDSLNEGLGCTEWNRRNFQRSWRRVKCVSWQTTT